MSSNPVISLDKNKLDVAKIHNYLCHHSYWGKGRSLKQVKTTIENSVCFGVYLNNEQIAYARVISDTVAFAYLMDVIVFEEYRGQGFGKLLMGAVLKHEEFKTVSWLLRTSDAQSLYEKFGFSPINQSDGFMGKVTKIT